MLEKNVCFNTISRRSTPELLFHENNFFFPWQTGLVYVIALEGVKIGKISQSVERMAVKLHEAQLSVIFAVLATTSGIYPKIHSCLCYHKLIL